ncbi:MAG: dolichol kinase [Ectothiorhodospiraceae bacterium]|nr:dolichol kinase [Ectothiorhodospiraceae bacterium]
MSEKHREQIDSGEQKISFQYELVRKGIHLTSLSIPVFYYYVPKDIALWVLGVLTAAFVLGDVLRSFHEPSFRLYKKIFGRMLRGHEKSSREKTLNGASWVLISAMLSVILFPKLIAITAFSILIISDTAAALYGRKFGMLKFNGKSLEGTAAFVVSACIVIMFTPKVEHIPGEYFIAIAAAIVGALAEVFSFRIIDDNFAIPISIGITLWLLYLIFFPGMNVYVLEG